VSGKSIIRVHVKLAQPTERCAAVTTFLEPKVYKDEPFGNVVACVLDGETGEVIDVDALQAELTELRRVRDAVRRWGIAAAAGDAGHDAYEADQISDAAYDELWCAAHDAGRAVKDIADALAAEGER
jgi:hypothetical protein